MRKYLFVTIAAALLSVAVPAAAQDSGNAAKADEYAERYNLLVSKLGADGVGIETVLNNWAAVAPDDVRMLTGRFSYIYWVGVFSVVSFLVGILFISDRLRSQ